MFICCSLAVARHVHSGAGESRVAEAFEFLLLVLLGSGGLLRELGLGHLSSFHEFCLFLGTRCSVVVGQLALVLVLALRVDTALIAIARTLGIDSGLVAGLLAGLL